MGIILYGQSSYYVLRFFFKNLEILTLIHDATKFLVISILSFWKNERKKERKESEFNENFKKKKKKTRTNFIILFYFILFP
jgi:hypothetical protein